VSVLALATAGLAGVAWQVSQRIFDGAIFAPNVRKELTYERVEIVAVDDSTVTVRAERPGARMSRSGTWGIRWRDGYGRVGSILEARGVETRREFVSDRGSLAAGVEAQIDPFSFEGEPSSSLGLASQEVSVPTELGSFPAWHVPGTSTTWILFVHGKEARREEALRMIQIVAPLGFPSLVITYRNDPEALASADRRYHYGGTEWIDVEAAVRYALGHGATDVVLVGYSMGGAIVMSFLTHSADRTCVSRAILEAPMLRLDAVVDHGISRLRLPLLNARYPTFITELSKALAALRYGFRWSDFDCLAEDLDVRIPFLLLHGEEDTVVPFHTSASLASELDDLATLVLFPGADHVECWNVDPTRYRDVVVSFLSESGRSAVAR